MIKIADESERKLAFELIVKNYKKKGYNNPNFKYHDLKDTTVFVVKEDDLVTATFSLVIDNNELGLPMDRVFRDEVDNLRNVGKRVAEVTNLAAQNLSLSVFIELTRFMIRHAENCGVDTWLIMINPKHRLFYCKVMGFVPIDSRIRKRVFMYDHVAEAYMLNRELLRNNSPTIYKRLFE